MTKGSGWQAYKQMMRGRYEYLNNFMEEMQAEPEELKKMTKRQELRLMHKMRMQADSTKYAPTNALQSNVPEAPTNLSQTYVE